MLPPSITDCLEGRLLRPILKTPQRRRMWRGDKAQCLASGEEEGRNRVREMKHLFLIAFLDANTACPVVRSGVGDLTHCAVI